MTSEGATRIFKDFAGWTSTHGIPHIGSAQNQILRVFWTIIFFASTCAFAWQMSEIVKRYTKYEVTVGTKNDGSETWDAQLEQLAISRQFNESLRDELSYTLDGNDFSSHLLLQCVFNGDECKASHFKKRFYPEFGNCFEYNFDGKIMSTRAGPLYGLKVLALSNQAEYLPLSKSAGIRVSIHGQNEEPFPDAFSYAAAAGFVTSFGVKFEVTKRLSVPYGNCTAAKDMTDPEEYFYGSRYSTEGCFRTCAQKIILRDCKCGDPRYNLPGPNSTQFRNAVYCDIAASGSSSGSCVRKYETSAKLKELASSCACNQPCEESTYDIAVSTALWPSDVFVVRFHPLFTPLWTRETYEARMEEPEPDICEEIRSPSNYLPWNWQLEAKDPRENTMIEKVKEKCVEWYAKNTMQFEVYYERMNYQVLSQGAAYDFTKVISDMGGQLGLWMGVSVISVIEFIIFLLMLGWHCCCAKENDDDSSDEETDSEEEEKAANPFNNMKNES